MKVILNVICEKDKKTKFIELIEKLKTQDTKLTRKPVIYEVRNVKFEKCYNFAEADEVEIYLESTNKIYSNVDELLEALKKLDIDVNCNNMYEIFEEIKKNDLYAVIYYYKKIVTVLRGFLTADAANDYKEKIENDYQGEIYIYVRHEDNPELEMLLDLLEGCEIV